MSDTSNTSYTRGAGYTSDAAGVRPRRVAAVVLAAGFSSRMGTFKPLLPLGSTTAIERVIGSLRAAGVADIVVVTGHSADEIAPVLDRLGVRRAHNAGFVDGMFSSVRTGMAGLWGDGALPPDAALPGGLDAFLILPVDCPLVTPSALRRLIAGFEPGGLGILYPTCLGRRGHPPLLAARYAPLLLAADAGGNLQAFLGAHPDDWPRSTCATSPCLWTWTLPTTTPRSPRSRPRSTPRRRAGGSAARAHPHSRRRPLPA